MTEEKCPFEDIEYINFRDGGRFDTPSRTERKSIAPGSLAKVAYRGDQGVEDLWIEVDERTTDRYRGRVDRIPSASMGIAAGEVVYFEARHVLAIYRRQATMPTAGYAELLADAETLDAQKYWTPVLQMEDARMEERTPPSMRGPEGAERRTEYLRRHPLCASCESRGLRAEATHVIYAGGPEQGDGDDNLMPMCRISLYVVVAREAGWPVRGSDIAGMPNDPQHPWNE